MSFLLSASWLIDQFLDPSGSISVWLAGPSRLGHLSVLRPFLQAPKRRRYAAAMCSGNKAGCPNFEVLLGFLHPCLFWIYTDSRIGEATNPGATESEGQRTLPQCFRILHSDWRKTGALYPSVMGRTDNPCVLQTPGPCGRTSTT